MTARQYALVPLSAEQQAAWRAVAETEKRRHQGKTLAEYPYAGAFFRCLNGSRRISLSDLRFFMPSLTAEELRGNRSQWLYAVDVLIETQGEVSQVWVLVLVNAGGEPFAVVQVQRRFAPEAVSHSLALAASLDTQGYGVNDIIHILMAEGGQV